MLLTIDVGNTHIVLGAYRGDRLERHWRLHTEPERTADEYGVLFLGLFETAGAGPPDITGIAVSSVVPPMNETIDEMCRKYFGHAALFVGPGVKTGMAILYENPREVGADRIVNAVAAFEWAKSGVIVVDFGTATTFDCVTPKGEYLGGVITPGVQISAEALFSRAARLHRVEIALPPKVVGRNPVHSMQSGIVYGYAGLVDGLTTRLKKEL